MVPLSEPIVRYSVALLGMKRRLEKRGLNKGLLLLDKDGAILVALWFYAVTYIPFDECMHALEESPNSELIYRICVVKDNIS